MKVAASDFDGTLYHKGVGICAEDLEAVRRWQEHGNRFGLVTGRNLHLVQLTLADYDIRLDFCVALNGAVVFDGEGREVFSAELSREAVRDLWEHEIVRESPYVMTLQGNGTFVKWNDPEWKDPWREVGLPQVTPEEAKEIPHILQMCFAARSPERAGELAKDLNEQFRGLLSAEANLFYIDVCAVGNNKGAGLAHLQEKMGWEKAPLYVIGDDMNDISMIQRFGGFAMENGNPEVKRAARRIFSSVGAMLEEMDGNHRVP